jgi:hypothetical protein
VEVDDPEALLDPLDVPDTKLLETDVADDTNDSDPEEDPLETLLDADAEMLAAARVEPATGEESVASGSKAVPVGIEVEWDASADATTSPASVANPTAGGEYL